MTKKHSVVSWGERQFGERKGEKEEIEKGFRKLLRINEYVHYFHFCKGFTGIYICQNISLQTLKRNHVL